METKFLNKTEIWSIVTYKSKIKKVLSKYKKRRGIESKRLIDAFETTFLSLEDLLEAEQKEEEY